MNIYISAIITGLAYLVAQGTPSGEIRDVESPMACDVSCKYFIHCTASGVWVKSDGMPIGNNMFAISPRDGTVYSGAGTQTFANGVHVEGFGNPFSAIARCEDLRGGGESLVFGVGILPRDASALVDPSGSIEIYHNQYDSKAGHTSFYKWVDGKNTLVLDDASGTSAYVDRANAILVAVGTSKGRSFIYVRGKAVQYVKEKVLQAWFFGGHTYWITISSVGYTLFRDGMPIIEGQSMQFYVGGGLSYKRAGITYGACLDGTGECPTADDSWNRSWGGATGLVMTCTDLNNKVQVSRGTEKWVPEGKICPIVVSQAGDAEYFLISDTGEPLRFCVNGKETRFPTIPHWHDGVGLKWLCVNGKGNRVYAVIDTVRLDGNMRVLGTEVLVFDADSKSWSVAVSIPDNADFGKAWFDPNDQVRADYHVGIGEHIASFR